MGRKAPQSLTVLEARAITLLASGYSQRDVAIKLGITPVTMTNWSKTERFKNARKQAIETLYNAAMGELTDGMQLACRELLKIIEDPDTPQKTKISAITVMLNHVSRNRTETNISDVIDVEEENISIDSLVRTATTREDLIEAINLKFKHEQWQFATANKMTDTAYKEGINQIIEVLAKRVTPETLEEILEDMKYSMREIKIENQIKII